MALQLRHERWHGGQRGAVPGRAEPAGRQPAALPRPAAARRRPGAEGAGAVACDRARVLPPLRRALARRRRHRRRGARPRLPPSWAGGRSRPRPAAAGTLAVRLHPGQRTGSDLLADAEDRAGRQPRRPHPAPTRPRRAGHHYGRYPRALSLPFHPPRRRHRSRDRRRRRLRHPRRRWAAARRRRTQEPRQPRQHALRRHPRLPAATARPTPARRDRRRGPLQRAVQTRARQRQLARRPTHPTPGSLPRHPDRLRRHTPPCRGLDPPLPHHRAHRRSRTELTPPAGSRLTISDPYRLLFVGGEAGVGKTVLLRRFSDRDADSARTLWGACDALITPRPLGPFLDIAQVTGGELQKLVESGARPHQVATALMCELGVRVPTVLVLEDVHWADGATLDVLRLLGRRLRGVPALVLASYRDDELERTHPLRMLLGELVTSETIGRLKIDPLSLEAVASLAGPGVDTDALYRKTGGNPFFVTEALASGGAEIPPTIRDAVLARCARVSATARMVLDAVAVVPFQPELWLLEALVEEAVDHLDECLASGMLTTEPGGVAFRHELARLAVEGSLAPNRRVVLHRRALGALAEPATGAPDPARLAYHAEAAGDADAVLEFAPAAGER